MKIELRIAILLTIINFVCLLLGFHYIDTAWNLPQSSRDISVGNIEQNQFQIYQKGLQLLFFSMVFDIISFYLFLSYSPNL